MSEHTTTVRAERLAEFVACLTGEHPADSAAATSALARRRDAEPLAVVARAIVDLRESGRSLRVTRYLDRPFEPVIDLRQSACDGDCRFRRHDRAGGSGLPRRRGRPADSTSGFVPA